MAQCELCEQEMLEPAGCTYTHVQIGETVFERIAYGKEEDDWGAAEGHNCHDCNVPPDSQHHPGCDVERCPSCQRQLISCDCRLLWWMIGESHDDARWAGNSQIDMSVLAGAQTAPLLAAYENLAEQAAAVPEAVATARKPRQRNYRAMKPDKLLRCRDELLSQGEAYQKCVQGGSGDPVADLALVNHLIQERGL